jgi:hypothetical protein
MSLQTRVEKLEQQHDPGLCACIPGNSEIRRYDGANDEEAAAESDTRPPLVCAVCRLEKRIIKLVRVNNWRSNDEVSA